MKKLLNSVNDNKLNPISTVLDVTESFLKSKIISNEKDIFSLVCFNVENKNNCADLDGVNVLYNLCNPDAYLIKQIRNLSQTTNPKLCPNDYKETLIKHFPPTDESKYYLSNALWVCHSMFKDYDKTKYFRRIFLFTNNDNPLSNETQEKDIVFQRARDMIEGDISIELFPLNFSGIFDIRKFYENIILANTDQPEENDNTDCNKLLSMEKCEDRLRELKKRIRQKEVKKGPWESVLFT